MGRKSVKQLARDKQLAATRTKRWAKESTEAAETPLGTSPAASEADNLSIQTLSLSEFQLPTSNDASGPSDDSLTASPYDPNDPGIDPENMPFEDPESVADGSEDGIRDNDGWWEKEIAMEELISGEEDNAIRIDNQPIPDDIQVNLVNKLDEIVRKSFKGQGKARRSMFDEVTLSRIRLMVSSLRITQDLKCGLVEGSRIAAVAVGRKKWAAEATRKWIRAFWRLNDLPPNIYGKCNESVIEDEDLQDALKQHLRCIGRYVGPKDIVDFFSKEEGEPFKHLLDEPPSLRTAQRWMPILGYHWRTEKRGMFVDGHEREDVVNFRQNNYIPKILALERRMRSWDEDGNEILPNLAPGEKEVNLNFHDESIFRAHERRMTRWIEEGETAGLYKKGEGLTEMVAEMISAKRGFLRRPGEPSEENPEDHSARVLFRPGKERDGYFCNKDVCEQLERACRILSEEYPEDENWIVFDNAKTHTMLPPTAAVVSRMTLGPSRNVGGETVDLSGEKTKVKFAPVKFSDGSMQDLYYPDNHPKADLRGAFKGLAKILEERGIPGARKLKLQCPTSKGRTGCLRGRTDCCARTTMSNQPDILSQKTILQLLAESYGCFVIYLPKFHCELNPIEQVWGAAKRVYRDYPMSSSESDLIQNTISALDSVKLDSIRKFVARSMRFVHAYADGLNGQQAAWANKQYRGHRVVNAAVLRLVDDLNDG